MPTVLPKISTPLKLERFHSASRRVLSAAGIWRAVDSSSAMACSQAEWMLEVGAVRTVDPAHLDRVSEGVHGGLGELVGDEDDGTGILAHRIS
jgi:hypothetical protein